MAKSAKEKLAVDGTPKLAAKAKPNDKHEKKDLTIEEATIESPRPSRKRAGDYFDFGDEADRVAEELAGDSSKAADKAGGSKTSKPNKKAKTDGTADTSKKTGGKKSKTDNGELLEKGDDAEDTKKAKGKKADIGKKDVGSEPSADNTTVPEKEPEIAGRAKPGKSKKADTGTKDATDVKKGEGKKTGTGKEGAVDAKKGKGKKADVAENTADDATTLEERVVADDKHKQEEDARRHKSKIAVDAKKDVVVGPSGDTATVPEQVPETGNKAKRGKAAKVGAVSNAKGDVEKSTKKDSEKPITKNKPEGSKASKKTEKEGTAKEVEPKEKSTKNKSGKKSGAAGPEPSAKITKAAGSKDAAAGNSKSASAAEPMDQAPFENLLDSTDKGKAPVPDEKKPSKAAKVKKDTKKPAKQAVTEKAPKKAKDDEAAKPKKAAKDGETEKPKTSAKVKENKADIPDQAIQPSDLVEEEAAMKEPSKTEPSKGKKRKAPSDVAAETVKSNVLDPLSEHAAQTPNKKSKKPRKSLGETLGDIVATGADAVRSSFTGILGSGGGGADGKRTTTGSSHKQSKGKGKATDTNDPQPSINEDDDEDDDEDDEDEGDAPDDQTAALLAGFESDGDDVHPPGDAGFKEGSKIPSLPKSKATKKLKSIKSAENDTPGVVYIGRIPHGFYEHEMRTYFNQFGDVNRLRLSRSVKTGHSKHYAFLEFKNVDVAKIVAETMDNYLMFGHILKCKLVAPGDVHESMWKGADKRFKKVPWNKMEGRKLEMAVGRDVWKKREEKETVKRAEKSKKTMEKVGYAFEGTGLKSVDTVPKKGVAEATEQEKSLVTAGGEEQANPVVVSEEVTRVKATQAGNVVAEAANVSVTKLGKRASEAGEEAVASVTKKAKKTKKDVTA